MKAVECFTCGSTFFKEDVELLMIADAKFSCSIECRSEILANLKK